MLNRLTFKLAVMAMLYAGLWLSGVLHTFDSNPVLSTGLGLVALMIAYLQDIRENKLSKREY